MGEALGMVETKGLVAMVFLLGRMKGDAGGDPGDVGRDRYRG